jgi:hypothetical protein
LDKRTKTNSVSEREGENTHCSKTKSYSPFEEFKHIFGAAWQPAPDLKRIIAERIIFLRVDINKEASGQKAHGPGDGGEKRQYRKVSLPMR